MSWVQKVENYGKCIIVNDNAELEPVKCDSSYNTICSVIYSLLIKKHGILDGMQKMSKENRSTGKLSLFNIHVHDTIAYNIKFQHEK